MKSLFQQKHELWLNILFASFAINNEEIKSKLYDFSQIAFRHMKWIAQDSLQKGSSYNYDRDLMLYKRESVFEILNHLISEVKTIQKSYGNDELSKRLFEDDKYLIEYISTLLDDDNNNAKVTAFNMQRK